MSKTTFYNDNNIKYVGVDVVESLINSHITNFPNKVFLNVDITTYKFFDNVDLIIIRDVIFHLKNEEIVSIFNNLKNKFKYIMITSCRNNNNNDDFNKWHFSEKNIHKEPFNISDKFQIKIAENVFNRNVYIYTHDNFYNK
jgi:viroplasmin and RNaseH domain-containing protein